MKIQTIDVCAGNVVYRWRESFNNVWHETRCEVISHNDKTAVIKLLGFGKDGRRPGSQMRVKLTSLVGFKQETPKEVDDKWKGYTYFD